MAHWLIVVLAVCVINIVYLIVHNDWRWAEQYLLMADFVAIIVFWLIFNFWLALLAAIIEGSWVKAVFYWLDVDYYGLHFESEYNGYSHYVSCSKCNYKDVVELPAEKIGGTTFAHTICPRCNREDFWGLDFHEEHYTGEEFWDKKYNQ